MRSINGWVVVYMVYGSLEIDQEEMCHKRKTKEVKQNQNKKAEKRRRHKQHPPNPFSHFLNIAESVHLQTTH